MIQRPPFRACLSLVMTLAHFGGARVSLAASNPSRPNVIVVLIDDMGWGDLGCFGSAVAKTPNIDRLAAEGMRFKQFYVNSPICSPSRTALTTGRYPQQYRINSYLGYRQENRRRGTADWLDPLAPTVPRVLQKAGYTTGHFGKWHMGGQRDVGDAPLISDYGFDRSLTNFEGLGDRVLPLCFSPPRQQPRKHTLGSDQLGRGEITWRDRAQVTAAYVDAATEFIDQAAAKSQPFYVNLWPDDVHSPFFPPLDKWGDGSKRNLYLAVLESMDHQLGRLFDLVRNSAKLRNNTVILLCSDNGPEPGAGSAGPFRGHKAVLLEGGIRSPLIVWAPGAMNSEAVGTWNDESVFAEFDLAASLVQLGHAQAIDEIKFDGQPLANTLLGKSTVGHQGALCFRRPPDRDNAFGMRDQRGRVNAPDLAIRSGKWKLLCEYDGREAQLYDLTQDPAETTNLAERDPDVVASLSAELIAWNRSLPTDKVAELRVGKHKDQPASKQSGLSIKDFPAPLFVDPNYGGSCDPEIVWNGRLREWWIYYTARRSMRANASYVGTPIGVATSPDLKRWSFAGYCAFDGVPGQPDNIDTRWAPGIVQKGHDLHMFVTHKPTAEPPWGGVGEIRHYVATGDLRTSWVRAADPDFPQPDPIDVTILPIGEKYQAYYRVGNGRGIQWSESADLTSWQHHGPCPGDVNERSVHGWDYQEAPYVFNFAGVYWMLTDPHEGLGVYRSEDAITWKLAGSLLKEPGVRRQDRSRARHPSVAVSGSRAWLCYHVEPNRPYPTPPPEQRTPRQKRSVLQMAELRVEGKRLVADRGARETPQ